MSNPTTATPGSSSAFPQRSQFSHYLPRLKRTFYQGDAFVLWTFTIANRATGWLSADFHFAFREMTLHVADREQLLCPAYCLMPDHLHFIWAGLSVESDQLNGIRFLRAELGPYLHSFRFQHQAHDRVLFTDDRSRERFGFVCSDYVLLNPVRAGLVDDPWKWAFSGAVIPGYPRFDWLKTNRWEWFWERFYRLRDPSLDRRILPPKSME